MIPVVDKFNIYLGSERNYSPNTLRAYMRDLKEFLSFVEEHDFGKIETGSDIAKIDDLVIRAYLGSLHTKNTRTTVSRKLTALRTFFDFLMREHPIDHNPAKLVPTPKKQKKLPTFLTVDEMFMLLDADFSDDASGLRNKAILELLYSSGIRVSELHHLNLDDLDLSESLVRVVGKGGKERIVPIGSKTVEALEKYLPQRGCLKPKGDYVFINRLGGRLTQRSIARVVKKYSLLAGINKNVHPHALRHSFATHMLGNGAELRAIQELLGHSNLSTTQNYLHLTVEKLMDVYDKAHPRA